MMAAHNGDRCSSLRSGEQPRLLRGPDGRAIPMPIFDCVDDQTDHPDVIRTLAENGMGAFSARTGLILGEPDEGESIARIAAKMDVLAANAPEARLLLSLQVDPGPAWRKSHPRQLTVSREGRYTLQGSHPGYRVDEVAEERIWKEAEISVFSAEETAAAQSAVTRLLRELLLKPYGDRLVGVFFQKYVYGEWAVPHWNPDWSAPAREYLRRFLKARYGDDRALREAWGVPDASLEDPEYAWRESVYHRLDLGLFKLENQSLRDYLEAEALALAEKFHGYCAAVKKMNPGYVAGGFFGYGQPFHSEIRSVLGDGIIDFICTPMEYTNRQPGGGVSTQCPFADMPPLRGVVFFDELDTATHMAPEVMNNVGRPRNRRETEGVLWRDVGQMIVNGHAGWYLDFAGNPGHASCGPHRDAFPRRAPSWHADPSVQPIHRRLREVWDRVESFDRTPVAEVRVFYPPRNNRMAAIGPHKRIEFPMAGVPLEELTLCDLLDGSAAPARLNVLFWPVALGAEEGVALRRLLDESPAHWLVYGPAGLVDSGRTALPDIGRVERITGFALDLDWLPEPRVQQAIPVGRLVDSPLRVLPSFGQSHKTIRSANVSCLPGERELRRRPLPADPVPMHYRVTIRPGEGMEALGVYEGDRKVGMAMRQNRAGGRVCLFPLPVLNSELFRILLDWAGGHLYIREDAYLIARRGLLLLHQARTGEYVVELPRPPREVIDLRRGRPAPCAGRSLHLHGLVGTTHFIKIRPAE